MDDTRNSRETRRSASITSTSMTMTGMEVKLIENSDSDTTCIDSNATFGAKEHVEMASFGSMSSGDLNKSTERHHLAKARKLMLNDFNFMQRLGNGDIGTVYLVELKGNRGVYFAAKVMDKEELAYRNKESRAGIEREILEMLDHPFCPSLYATLECPRWSCLLTEFCPGGDLHVLRQCQPDKRFNEDVVRSVLACYSSHIT